MIYGGHVSGIMYALSMYQGEFGVYRGNRFITSFMDSRRSDKEIPDIEKNRSRQIIAQLTLMLRQWIRNRS